MFQEPLCGQHHHYALAAALGMPDDAALVLGDTLLGRLHAGKLVWARHLLLPGVEDDEVADQIEQPGPIAQLSERAIEERSDRECWAGRCLVLPLNEELLRRTGGAVAQP